MATSSSKSILSSKDSIGNQDSRATCKFRKWTTENTLGEDIEGKSPKNCQSFSLFKGVNLDTAYHGMIL